MGAPKGNTFSATGRAFNRRLRAIIEREKGKRLDAAINKLLTQAAKGNLAAIDMLAERLDGKATQQLELEASASMLAVLQAVEQRRVALKRAPVTIDQPKQPPKGLPPVVKRDAK